MASSLLTFKAAATTWDWDEACFAACLKFIVDTSVLVEVYLIVLVTQFA